MTGPGTKKTGPGEKRPRIFQKCPDNPRPAVQSREEKHWETPARSRGDPGSNRGYLVGTPGKVSGEVQKVRGQKDRGGDKKDRGTRGPRDLGTRCVQSPLSEGHRHHCWVQWTAKTAPSSILLGLYTGNPRSTDRAGGKKRPGIFRLGRSNGPKYCISPGKRPQNRQPTPRTARTRSVEHLEHKCKESMEVKFLQVSRSPANDRIPIILDRAPSRSRSRSRKARSRNPGSPRPPAS
jgi:hypothetical protein